MATTTADVVKSAYNSALSTLESVQAAYDQANNDYLNGLNDAADGKELSIDESSHSLLAQYPIGKSPYIGSQYTVPYNGGYLISYASGSDTVYQMMDSSMKYVSKMTITDGGHGSSFGVDGSGNIWAVVKCDGYQISKFPYQAGQTIAASSLSSLFNSEGMLRVNYDATNNLVGYTTADSYCICDPGNLSSPKNTISISTMGFTIGEQTWESQSLSYPYVFWQSGAYNSNSDPATVGCYNVETNTQVFVKTYNTGSYGMKYGDNEPEGIYSTGSAILVTFNNNDNGANAINYLFSIPTVTADSSTQTKLDDLNRLKKSLADAQSAYNSAKSDYQKYQQVAQTVTKDTAKVKSATKAVTADQKKVTATNKKLTALKKEYAKATGSKKTALAKQIAATEKTLHSQKNTLAKAQKTEASAKSKLSKAKKAKPSLAAEKLLQRAILKKAISAAVMAETGGKDVTWITPFNPGSKESYAVLWPDSEDFSETVNVNETAVIKHTPINTVTQAGTESIAVSGALIGEDGDVPTLVKKFERVRKWAENTAEVELHGQTSFAHSIISAIDKPHDTYVTNQVPLSITLQKVDWADSNVKKKKSASKNKGKANKKAGSGHKQNSSKSSVKTVTTKSGDTYYKFSIKYNVSVSQLRKWNKYPDRSIPVGVKIRVK